jgi:hypothetical protein
MAEAADQHQRQAQYLRRAAAMAARVWIGPDNPVPSSTMARQIATIRYKTVNNRVVFNDGFWRKADIRRCGGQP